MKPRWLRPCVEEIGLNLLWAVSDPRLEKMEAIILKHTTVSIAMPDHLASCEAFTETWATWISYLTKKKGKKPTTHTLELHMKKLTPLKPKEAIGAIERAMESSWSSIFIQEEKTSQRAKPTLVPRQCAEAWNGF